MAEKKQHHKPKVFVPEPVERVELQDSIITQALSDAVNKTKEQFYYGMKRPSWDDHRFWLVTRALKNNGANTLDAAKELGVSYATIHRIITQMDVKIPLSESGRKAWLESIKDIDVIPRAKAKKPTGRKPKNPK